MDIVSLFGHHSEIEINDIVLSFFSLGILAGAGLLRLHRIQELRRHVPKSRWLRVPALLCLPVLILIASVMLPVTLGSTGVFLEILVVFTIPAIYVVAFWNPGG